MDFAHLPQLVDETLNPTTHHGQKHPLLSFFAFSHPATTQVDFYRSIINQEDRYIASELPEGIQLREEPPAYIQGLFQGEIPSQRLRDNISYIFAIYDDSENFEEE